jgi:hypothetical protein
MSRTEQLRKQVQLHHSHNTLGNFKFFDFNFTKKMIFRVQEWSHPVLCLQVRHNDQAHDPNSSNGRFGHLSAMILAIDFIGSAIWSAAK